MPARSAPISKFAEVKAAYLRGEGSCRELADRFGLSVRALEQRACREGWRKELSKIGEQVSRATAQKVTNAATAWIEDALRLSNQIKSDVQACREQFATDAEERPVIDALNIRTMAQALRIADDLGRRALGIPDTPQKVEHSGSVAVFSQKIQDEAVEAWTLLRSEIIKTDAKPQGAE